MKEIKANDIIEIFETLVKKFNEADEMLKLLSQDEVNIDATLESFGTIDAELTLLDFLTVHKKSFENIEYKLEFLKRIYEK